MLNLMNLKGMAWIEFVGFRNDDEIIVVYEEYSTNENKKCIIKSVRFLTHKPQSRYTKDIPRIVVNRDKSLFERFKISEENR